jgi:hypothetical protein
MAISVLAYNLTRVLNITIRPRHVGSWSVDTVRKIVKLGYCYPWPLCPPGRRRRRSAETAAAPAQVHPRTAAGAATGGHLRQPVRAWRDWPRPVCGSLPDRISGRLSQLIRANGRIRNWTKADDPNLRFRIGVAAWSGASRGRPIVGRGLGLNDTTIMATRNCGI